ncbi:hypothetical protein BDW22DRAFT_763322 [Trametopsis cervina]|nr:hypothetical protein BDW22DRAFT_763322 [Trametopsis cervina]
MSRACKVEPVRYLPFDYLPMAPSVFSRPKTFVILHRRASRKRLVLLQRNSSCFQRVGSAASLFTVMISSYRQCNKLISGLQWSIYSSAIHKRSRDEDIAALGKIIPKVVSLTIRQDHVRTAF